METIKDPVLFAILAFRDISNADVQMAGTLRSLLRFFLCASAAALPLVTLTAWVLTPMWPAYAKDITLGAVQMTAETEWFRTIELGIRAAADKAGAKVLVGNARAQVDTEAQIVDNFVARGVDAIIISAFESDKLCASAQACCRQRREVGGLQYDNRFSNYDDVRRRG